MKDMHPAPQASSDLLTSTALYICYTEIIGKTVDTQIPWTTHLPQLALVFIHVTVIFICN